MTRLPRRTAALTTVVTGTLALALVGGTGTAFAYWRAGSAGAGVARAGTAEDLTVSPGTPATALVPGGTTDVTVTIGNPAAYPVTLTAVSTVSGPVGGYADTALTTPVASCDATRSGVTVVAKSPTSALPTIPARGSVTLTVLAAAVMTNASDTTCQGLSFRIPVTATGQSAA